MVYPQKPPPSQVVYQAYTVVMVYILRMLSLVIVITFVFTDEDECAIENGGCEQICTNSVGSFQCSCEGGHKLAPDGKACIEIGQWVINKL